MGAVCRAARKILKKAESRAWPEEHTSLALKWGKVCRAGVPSPFSELKCVFLFRPGVLPPYFEVK